MAGTEPTSSMSEKNPPPASEGVSPPIPAPSPRARGAGPVCSGAAAAAAAAPGLSGGGGLPAVQGSGDSRSARPRGDPAEMEAASSGAEPPGKGFLPSSAPLQSGKACFERLRGGRGLRLGPGSGSRRASRAQRGDRRAVAALGSLRRLGRLLSLPSTRGQTGSAQPGRATDRRPDQ